MSNPTGDALQVPSREGEAWQPIETAPKDGTYLLLGFWDRRAGSSGEDEWVAVCGWYENGPADRCWYESGRDGGRVRPSHWQRLPAPPGTVSTLLRQGVDVPEELRKALARLNQFAKDAPQLDFNEDQTLSWIAVYTAKIDALLARSDAAPDAVGEDRPALTPQQLATFIESMAENPKGGKPARSAYLHAARLIRERLA